MSIYSPDDAWYQESGESLRISRSLGKFYCGRFGRGVVESLKRPVYLLCSRAAPPNLPVWQKHYRDFERSSAKY